MSTTLDAKIIPKITTILAKYGTDVTFKAYASQVYQEDGSISLGAADDKTVKATPPAPITDVFRTAGQSISGGDTVIFIGAENLTWAPVKDQKVVHNGIEFVAVEVREYHSGDDIALYGVILKR